MMKVALSSLVHEPGKLIAALVGVAFAATLVLVQGGLYYGFRDSSARVISQVGGDVWVMAKGTALLDFSDPISDAALQSVASHACVTQARGLVMAWTTLRKASGAMENVQLIGFYPDETHPMPWSLQTGLASDLHAPLRIAVDRLDLERLELPPDATGEPVLLNDRTTYVGAITSGIRAFTVVPYVFAELKNAQRIVGLESAYSFIVLDLKDPSCAADVKAFVDARRDLTGHTREEFREMTASYWVARSGIGETIRFTAFLSFTVGLVIVAQVLFALTESRLRELATLKAMGAGSLTLLSYVAWQAGVLAAGGASMGTLVALLVRGGAASAGLAIVLSPQVLLLGLGAIVLMCAVASVGSGRKILTLPPSEVFR